MRVSQICRYLGFAMLWVGLAVRADAATITVAWDANPEPEVTGYLVCARTAGQSCGTGAAIGNRTTWTFTGLAHNAQYFLAVRAQSATGMSAWAELGVFTPAPLPAGSDPTRGDFNSDWTFDLIWQHQPSGQMIAWHMNGPTMVSQRWLNPQSVAAGWRMTGAGDLNLDGKPDLVWQNDSTGQISYWLMDGVLAYASNFFNPSTAAVGWRIMSVRDMNRDGHPDFIWYSAASGQLVVWYMNGTLLASQAWVNPNGVSDTNWRPMGTGDFNSDGWADIIWHNQTTGALHLWAMNGVNLVWSAPFSPASVSPQWQLSAIGDANGDARPDIYWENTSTGHRALWLLNGTTLVNSMYLSTPIVDVNWKIRGPR